MAHPSDHRLCNRRVLRLVLVLMGLLLVGYIVALPFFWYSKDNSSAQGSCPSCSCDCSSETETIISIPFGLLNSSYSGLLNSSYSDCGKDDPEMNEEMKKDIITLLSEELSLHKNVSDDNLKHSKALIMDARKTSSHYQREAEKCNTGMETCEEAREIAQAALIQERKLSALWESRAREYGWKDKRRVYSSV